MKPVLTATERKRLLLEHPDISTWIKDRSPGTASVQLDHVRIFLERTGLDVDGLVRLAKEDERKLRNAVLDFIHERQSAGLKAKYVGNIWWSVRSFLASVGAAPAWNPTVKETEADEENASRVVPTHEQVRQIANAVKSARDRMVVLVLASSGVRIGTFGTQNGNADGLRLKNIIDLTLDPEPRFERRPPMLRVPAFLSKGGKGYYTGLTEEAGEAVIAYLKERTHRGEKLSPESPLVVPDARGVRESRKSKDGHEFVMRKSLASRVQAAMDVVAPHGIRWTPHSLRAFASTQLEAAEARGLVSKTRREYFLGHALGSTDTLYNLGRTLSPAKIEELRGSWNKVLPFLDLTQSERRQADTKAALLTDLLTAIETATGKKAEDGALTAESLKSILRDALQGSPGEPGTATGPTPTASAVPTAVPAPKRTGEQRSVDAESVGRYLENGWSFVSPLNSHLAVVKWDGAVP